MICGVLRSRGVHVWIASHSQVKAGATIISVNTRSPTHFDIFCDTCLKRELLIPELITRRSAKKREPCFFFPANKMQKKQTKCAAPYNLIDYVAIISVFFCLSALWQAGCEWMAHSIPLCVCAERQPCRGLEREGIVCHIQMLQICSLPHMWIGTPLSGAPLVLHEQRHSQGDKQAETEVKPSLKLLRYGITRFMSRLKLYPLIVSQDFLRGKLSKPLMVEH